MCNNLKKAIDLIENTAAVLAAVSDNETYTSEKRGIAALMECVSNGKNFSAMSVADRVVGKSAAMLMAALNVKEVYAKVISAYAIDFFEKHGIRFTYDKKCDYIVNRAGNGMCPMEETVLEIHDIATAVEALKNKLDKLRRNS